MDVTPPAELYQYSRYLCVLTLSAVDSSHATEPPGVEGTSSGSREDCEADLGQQQRTPSQGSSKETCVVGGW